MNNTRLQYLSKLEEQLVNIARLAHSAEAALDDIEVASPSAKGKKEAAGLSAQAADIFKEVQEIASQFVEGSYARPNAEREGALESTLNRLTADVNKIVASVSSSLQKNADRFGSNYERKQAVQAEVSAVAAESIFTDQGTSKILVRELGKVTRDLNQSWQSSRFDESKTNFADLMNIAIRTLSTESYRQLQGVLRADTGEIRDPGEIEKAFKNFLKTSAQIIISAQKAVTAGESAGKFDIKNVITGKGSDISDSFYENVLKVFKSTGAPPKQERRITQAWESVKGTVDFEQFLQDWRRQQDKAHQARLSARDSTSSSSEKSATEATSTRKKSTPRVDVAVKVKDEPASSTSITADASSGSVVKEMRGEVIGNTPEGSTGINKDERQQRRRTKRSLPGVAVNKEDLAAAVRATVSSGGVAEGEATSFLDRSMRSFGTLMQDGADLLLEQYINSIIAKVDKDIKSGNFKEVSGVKVPASLARSTVEAARAVNQMSSVRTVEGRFTKSDAGMPLGVISSPDVISTIADAFSGSLLAQYMQGKSFDSLGLAEFKKQFTDEVTNEDKTPEVQFTELVARSELDKLYVQRARLAREVVNNPETHSKREGFYADMMQNKQKIFALEYILDDTKEQLFAQGVIDEKELAEYQQNRARLVGIDDGVTRVDKDKALGLLMGPIQAATYQPMPSWTMQAVNYFKQAQESLLAAGLGTPARLFNRPTAFKKAIDVEMGLEDRTADFDKELASSYGMEEILADSEGIRTKEKGITVAEIFAQQLGLVSDRAAPKGTGIGSFLRGIMSGARRLDYLKRQQPMLDDEYKAASEDYDRLFSKYQATEERGETVSPELQAQLDKAADRVNELESRKEKNFSGSLLAGERRPTTAEVTDILVAAEDISRAQTTAVPLLDAVTRSIEVGGSSINDRLKWMKKTFPTLSGVLDKDTLKKLEKIAKNRDSMEPSEVYAKLFETMKEPAQKSITGMINKTMTTMGLSKEQQDSIWKTYNEEGLTKNIPANLFEAFQAHSAFNVAPAELFNALAQTRELEGSTAVRVEQAKKGSFGERAKTTLDNLFGRVTMTDLMIPNGKGKTPLSYTSTGLVRDFKERSRRIAGTSGTDIFRLQAEADSDLFRAEEVLNKQLQEIAAKIAEIDAKPEPKEEAEKTAQAVKRRALINKRVEVKGTLNRLQEIVKTIGSAATQDFIRAEREDREIDDEVTEEYLLNNKDQALYGEDLADRASYAFGQLEEKRRVLLSTRASLKDVNPEIDYEGYLSSGLPTSVAPTDRDDLLTILQQQASLSRIMEKAKKENADDSIEDDAELTYLPKSTARERAAIAYNNFVERATGLTEFLDLDKYKRLFGVFDSKAPSRSASSKTKKDYILQNTDAVNLIKNLTLLGGTGNLGVGRIASALVNATTDDEDFYKELTKVVSTLSPGDLRRLSTVSDFGNDESQKYLTDPTRVDNVEGMKNLIRLMGSATVTLGGKSRTGGRRLAGDIRDLPNADGEVESVLDIVKFAESFMRQDFPLTASMTDNQLAARIRTGQIYNRLKSIATRSLSPTDMKDKVSALFPAGTSIDAAVKEAEKKVAALEKMFGSEEIARMTGKASDPTSYLSEATVRGFASSPTGGKKFAEVIPQIYEKKISSAIKKAEEAQTAFVTAKKEVERLRSTGASGAEIGKAETSMTNADAERTKAQSELQQMQKVFLETALSGTHASYKDGSLPRLIVRTIDLLNEGFNKYFARKAKEAEATLAAAATTPTVSTKSVSTAPAKAVVTTTATTTTTTTTAATTSRATITPNPYDRAAIEADTGKAYVISEQAALIGKAGEPGKGSTAARGLANAFPIVTRKKYDYDTRTEENYADTDEDFEEFKALNTQLIKNLSASGKPVVFPTNFADIKKEFLPPRFKEWLMNELSTAFGISFARTSARAASAATTATADPAEKPKTASSTESKKGEPSVKITGSGDYGSRTDRNAAAAPVTMVYAVDYETPGERRTRSAVAKAKNKLVVDNGENPRQFAQRIVAGLQATDATSLNVAGNAVTRFIEAGKSQRDVNKYIFEVLKVVKELYPKLQTIVSGGQTGADIAGAVAAYALGLDSDVFMPSGLIQRQYDYKKKKESTVYNKPSEILEYIKTGASFLLPRSSTRPAAETTTAKKTASPSVETVAPVVSRKADKGSRENPRTLNMSYVMENSAMREDLRAAFPEGTGMGALIKAGIRTATTRKPFSFKVGDHVNIPEAPDMLYQITDMRKPDFSTPEKIKEWEQKEGWSFADMPEAYKAQVLNPEAVQITYKPVGLKTPTAAASAPTSSAATPATAPTSSAAASRVRRVHRMTKAAVEADPSTYYLFGDNLKREGFGGQATIRNAVTKNVIGIPTKKTKSTDEAAYFTDADYDLAVAEIDKAFASIPKGASIVIPSDGIGTGRAQLETRAPKIFAYLQKKLKELESPEEKTVPTAAPVVPPATSSEKAINIYAGRNENTELSNFAIRPFTYKGRVYNSVEQAYQSLKSGRFIPRVFGLFGEKAKYGPFDRKGVMTVSKPTTKDAEAYRAEKGEDLIPVGDSTEASRVALMEELIAASFAQNPDAAARLMATGAAPLSHTQDRGIWANQFPRIMMAVRAKLAGMVTRSTKPAEEKLTLSAESTTEVPSVKMKIKPDRLTRSREKAKARPESAGFKREGADAVVTEPDVKPEDSAAEIKLPSATNAAKKLANRKGLNLSLIKGSGKDGFIVESDVIRYESELNAYRKKIKEDELLRVAESRRKRNLEKSKTRPEAKGFSAEISEIDFVPTRAKIAPISPAVRALALEKDIDLSTITGTGKNGALTKADVYAAEAKRIADFKTAAYMEYRSGAFRTEVNKKRVERRKKRTLERPESAGFALPVVKTVEEIEAERLARKAAEASSRPEATGYPVESSSATTSKDLSLRPQSWRDKSIVDPEIEAARLHKRRMERDATYRERIFKERVNPLVNKVAQFRIRSGDEVDLPPSLAKKYYDFQDTATPVEINRYNELLKKARLAAGLSATRMTSPVEAGVSSTSSTSTAAVPTATTTTTTATTATAAAKPGTSGAKSGEADSGAAKPKYEPVKALTIGKGPGGSPTPVWIVGQSGALHVVGGGGAGSKSGAGSSKYVDSAGVEVDNDKQGDYPQVPAVVRSILTGLDAYRNAKHMELAKETDPLKIEALQKNILGASKQALRAVLGRDEIRAATKYTYDDSLDFNENLQRASAQLSYNIGETFVETDEGLVSKPTPAQVTAALTLEKLAQTSRFQTQSMTQRPPSSYSGGGGAVRDRAGLMYDAGMLQLQAARNAFDQAAGSMVGGSMNTARKNLMNATRSSITSLFGVLPTADITTASGATKNVIEALSSNIVPSSSFLDQASATEGINTFNEQFTDFTQNSGASMDELAADLSNLTQSLVALSQAAEASKAAIRSQITSEQQRLQTLKATGAAASDIKDSEDTLLSLREEESKFMGYTDELGVKGKTLGMALNQQKQSAGVLDTGSSRAIETYEQQMRAAMTRPGLLGAFARRSESKRLTRDFARDFVGDESADVLFSGSSLVAYNDKGRKVALPYASNKELANLQARLKESGSAVSMEQLIKLQQTSAQLKQVGNQQPFSDPVFYVASKIRDIETLYNTGMQYTVQLPRQIAQTIQSVAEPALGATRTMVTAQGLARSPEVYTAALGAASTQQGMFGGSLTSNLGQITSFIPLTNAYGVDINQVVNVARKLAAFDPAQGMEGASIAIKEFLSGNVASLSRRFEINRSSLSKINQGDADQMLENLDEVLSQMGVTDRLIDEQANSLAAKYDKMLGRLESAEIAVSAFAVNVATPFVELIAGPDSWLAKNAKEISLDTVRDERMRFKGDSKLLNPKTGLASLDIFAADYYTKLDDLIASANEEIIKEAARYQQTTGKVATVSPYRRIMNMKSSDRLNLKLTALSYMQAGMNSGQAQLQALRDVGGDYAGYEEFAPQRRLRGTVTPMSNAERNNLFDELETNLKAQQNTRRMTILSRYDADTFKVLDQGLEKTLRISGIDAPEKESQLGQGAKIASYDIAADGDVIIVSSKGTDDYGRIVGSALVEKTGKDYAAEALSKGLATTGFMDKGDLAERTKEIYSRFEEVAGEAGIGPVNNEFAGLGLGANVSISQRARDKYFQDTYLFGGLPGTVGATSSSIIGGVTGVKLAGAVAGMTSGSAATAVGLGTILPALGIGALVGGAAYGGLTYWLDKNDTSTEKMKKLYQYEDQFAREDMARTEAQSFIGRAASMSPSAIPAYFSANVVKGIVEKTAAIVDDIEFQGPENYPMAPGETAAEFAKIKAVSETFAKGVLGTSVSDQELANFESAYVAASEKATNDVEELYNKETEKGKEFYDSIIDNPLTGTQTTYFDYARQLKTLLKMSSEYQGIGEFLEKIPENELFSPAQGLTQFKNNEELLGIAEKYKFTVDTAKLPSEMAKAAAPDYIKYRQGLVDRGVVGFSMENFIQSSAEDREEQLRQFKEQYLNPNNFKVQAKEYTNQMLEERMQIRQRRFNTIIEANALNAMAGLGYKDQAGRYLSGTGVQGEPPIYTPEGRALVMMRNQIIGTGTEQDEAAASELVTAQTNAVEKLKELADAYMEQANATLANTVMYNSSFANMTAAINMNGAAFGDMMNIMGQGDPMFVGKYFRQMSGIDFMSAMQGGMFNPFTSTGILGTSNSLLSPMVSTSGIVSTQVGVNGTPIQMVAGRNGAMQFANAYTQGPRGAIAFAQDMQSNPQIGDLLNPQQYFQTILAPAINGQTELARRGIQQGNQMRDLQRQHNYSLEDITRNGMRQLEDIHRNYTRNMFQLAMNNEITKRMDRGNMFQSILAADIPESTRNEILAFATQGEQRIRHSEQGDVTNFLARTRLEGDDISALIAAEEAYQATPFTDPDKKEEAQLARMSAAEAVKARLQNLIDTTDDPRLRAEYQSQLALLGKDPARAAAMAPVLVQEVQRRVQTAANFQAFGYLQADRAYEQSGQPLRRAALEQDVINAEKSDKSDSAAYVLRNQQARRALADYDYQLGVSTRGFNKAKQEVEAATETTYLFSDAFTTTFDLLEKTTSPTLSGILTEYDNFGLGIKRQIEDQAINFERQKLALVTSFSDAMVEIAAQVPSALQKATTAYAKFAAADARAQFELMIGNTDEAKRIYAEASSTYAADMFPDDADKQAKYSSLMMANMPKAAYKSNNSIMVGGLSDFAVMTADGPAMRVVATTALKVPMPPPSGTGGNNPPVTPVNQGQGPFEPVIKGISF
jgi:endonuclease YncB( thermonuclease family)/pyruvate/2-oxoglutarate dehydrogenase complex dihydrolipoamide acyltransferase (E2) component